MPDRLRPVLWLAPILFLLAAACGSPSGSEGAHVHGVARLTIALEDTSAEVVFEAPAESIYGFEHAPGNDEERAAQAEALAQLEDRFAQMLVLPADRGCQVTEAEAEVDVAAEGDEHEHEEDGLSGEHSEVHASYELRCESSLAGAQAEVALGDFFDGLEVLEVIVLTDEGQRATQLDGGLGRVDL